MTTSANDTNTLAVSPTQGPQWTFDGCAEYPHMHPLAGIEHVAWVDEFDVGREAFSAGDSIGVCTNDAQRDGWMDAEFDAGLRLHQAAVDAQQRNDRRARYSH